jgi:hypothetical protein
MTRSRAQTKYGFENEEQKMFAFDELHKHADSTRERKEKRVATCKFTRSAHVPHCNALAESFFFTFYCRP